MRALSLYQPWASLIAAGAKSNETRPRRAPKNADGELIAIHASKTEDSLFRHDEEVVSRLGTEPLPQGAIVAVAVLKDCIPTEHANPTPEENHFGDFSPGRWAWRLEDIQPLTEPVPCRGQPIMWEIGTELTAQVRANLDPRTPAKPAEPPDQPQKLTQDISR